MINGENLRHPVVEGSKSNAESVTNILRNARQPVQLTFAGDTGALEPIFSTQHPDIVLYSSNREHGYNFEGESA